MVLGLSTPFGIEPKHHEKIVQVCFQILYANWPHSRNMVEHGLLVGGSLAATSCSVQLQWLQSKLSPLLKDFGGFESKQLQTGLDA